MVSSLLFVNDTALLAENVEDMKRSPLYEKWSVEINEEKSVTMHMRKIGADRCSDTLNIGEDEIPLVSTFTSIWVAW